MFVRNRSERRSLALLLSRAKRLGIDLDARIDAGTYFSPAEIEGLVDALRERQRAPRRAPII